MEDILRGVEDEPGAGLPRRVFLKGAGATGLLAVAGGVGTQDAHAVAAVAASYQGLGDVRILNFAVQLEQIGRGLGAQAIDSGVLRDENLSAFRLIGENFTNRIRALTRRIRNADRSFQVSKARDNYTFGALDSEEAFLRAAIQVGSIISGAYAGSVAALQDKQNLALYAGCAQGLSRELATLRFLNGQNPAAEAFAETLTRQAVEKAIAPILGR